MSPAYDRLMDRLAELAVQAVRRTDVAAQAYWLSLLCGMPGGMATAGVRGARLVERATADPELPAWARSLAPGALLQLLRHDGLLRSEPAMCFTASEEYTWEDLGQLAGIIVSVPQIYHPYCEELSDDVQCLWRAVCRLYGPLPEAWTACPEEVRRGAVLFDAGLYFACHEYFEALWGRTEDEASACYQGFIQIAVAMRHLESHNLRGAVRLLRSGMTRVQRYPAIYKGLALGDWLTGLTSLLTCLQTWPDTVAYHFDPARIPPLLDENA